MLRRVPVLLFALLVPLVVAGPAHGAGERLAPVDIATESPALLVTAPRGDDRLFAAERAGRISVLLPGGQTREFLDFSGRVGTAGEGGLLGLAFSPDYDRDGRLYVHYTDTSGDTRIDRYTVSGDPNRADPGSRVQVLALDQPRSNHNGGSIEFAPDGTLLVALGDGGGANDPERNAQDLGSCLGGILRLGVLGRSGGGHTVPADNPLAGRTGRCELLWAWGLRNPYRMSVDGDDVWIGDVGQDRREEVNRLSFRPRGGYNLGWPRYEGTLDRGGTLAGGELIGPVEEYATNGSASVTGGYVVRSPSLPALRGHYVYGDFVRGFIRVYDPVTDRSRTLLEGVGNIVSFGQGGDGELYVLTFGGVRRLVGSLCDEVVGRCYFLNNVLTGGEADVTFVYGRASDEVFVGDWDGDGDDTLAVRRGAEFHLTNRLRGGDADLVFRYGRASDEIHMGDWDGDGVDTPAVRRGRTFHVTNRLRGGPAETVFVYGRTGDQVLVGDWDGDGRDTFGVRRGATYHLTNRLRGGVADVTFVYGRRDDLVLTGDWDGDGADTLAVRRDRTYLVTDRLRGGPAERTFVYGRSHDVTIVGDWDGDAADTFGVRR